MTADVLHAAVVKNLKHVNSTPAARSPRSGATRGKGGKRIGIRGGLVSKDCLPPRGKAIIDVERKTKNL